MDHNRLTGMSEALRLTRSGQLTEAVEVLQRTLGTDAGQPRPPRIPGLGKLRSTVAGLADLLGNLPGTGSATNPTRPPRRPPPAASSAT